MFNLIGIVVTVHDLVCVFLLCDSLVFVSNRGWVVHSEPLRCGVNIINSKLDTI